MKKAYKPIKIEIWIKQAQESIEETLKNLAEVIEAIEEKYPGAKLGYSAENVDVKNTIKEKIIELSLKELEILTEIQKKIRTAILCKRKFHIIKAKNTNFTIIISALNYTYKKQCRNEVFYANHYNRMYY